MRFHILPIACLSSLGVVALACGSSSSSPTTTGGLGGSTASVGSTSSTTGASTGKGGSSSTGNGGGSSSSNGGGSSTSAGGGTGSGGGGPTAFRAVTIPPDDAQDEERVTGVYCSSASACVVSTDPFADAGHIYSTDGQTITGTLVTGDDTEAAILGTAGTVSFLGFSHVGTQLIAHVDGAEGGLVSATGDVTKAASWTSVPIAVDLSDFGLNTQFEFATKGGTTTMMAKGRIWTTTDTPGIAATWTNIYSPQAVPPIPADIEDQRAADPTLCDTDPSVSIVPDLTQPLYIAPDLSVIITPSGAVNQDGNDPAGVCISTDGGVSFHNAAFTGVDVGAGPIGITCTSKDHCVAYGGVDSNPGSAYIYVSTNASKGATSTWTAATTPALADGTEFRSAAFAPDGMHGWIVGATGAPKPLLFTTADGGATWTNATSTIAALAGENRLHLVYAFDANHVWIGGENGLLLTSGD